jgi:predicted enzyme related to lactoylglutathione lyase
MAERTSYEPGTPSWVDLGSADTDAAAGFYSDLFGWTAEEPSGPETGGYRLFSLRGQPVAGLGPQQSPGPPFWSVYVTVSDVGESTKKIAEAGGEVVAGPMDVLDAGRMAVARDTVGSFVSIWEPNQHIGAYIVNEPGSFTWNELATTDLATARTFYTSVFGWGVDAEHDGDTAAIFTVNGRGVCGAHTAGEGEFPAWSVWFAVEDCDATAARAAELGGSILVPPNDMDFGRGAVVADPHGAVFGIGAVSEEMMSEAG